MTAESPVTVYATPSLQEYAENIALAYGLNVGRFKAVINCESRWNPTAIGDGGKSFGLAQFYMPERDWGFTKESALDPYFAIEAMAKAWSQGKQMKWSCYRKLFT